MGANIKHIDTQVVLATVGFACCFAWVFVAFPTTTVDSANPIRLGVIEQLVLRFLTVGVIAGVILPLATRWLQTGAVKIVFFTLGCFLQIIGIAFSNLVIDSTNQFILLLVAYFFTGSGGAVPLILWGVLLSTWETETCERSFIAIFVLVGMSIIIVELLPAVCTHFFILLVPLFELMLYIFATKATPDEEKNDCLTVASCKTCLTNREFTYLLFRTTIAITLVSFVWGIISQSAGKLPISNQILFGLGTVLSSFVIWMFTKYSTSVGFVAAAKWTLPIMAVGLLFSMFAEVEVICAACAILACAHGSLETILRMNIIAFAKRSSLDAICLVGWGFASIMFGAFLGPVLLAIIQPIADSEGLSLAVFALAILVIAGAFLFPAAFPIKSEDATSVSLDAAQRAELMRKRYGLSAREQEVLTYLLEGRSHPYIRDVLYISKSTVDTHVRHIYAKTDVNSKQALIDLSMKNF